MFDICMDTQPTTQGSGYGKRPLWQWIVIYVVIGIVVYGLIYYFVLAKRNGGSNYSLPGTQNQQQSNPVGY